MTRLREAQNRFKKRGKKWFNWSDKQADDEWKEALRNKGVAKSRDEYGNVTVAKLANVMAANGRNTASTRSLTEQRAAEVETSAQVAELGRGRQILCLNCLTFWAFEPFDCRS